MHDVSYVDLEPGHGNQLYPFQPAIFTNGSPAATINIYRQSRRQESRIMKSEAGKMIQYSQATTPYTFHEVEFL